MKILFDFDVILDVLLEREPFVKDALYLLAKIERSEINGLICASTVTTIHYMINKTLGPKEATYYIKILLSLFEMVPINRAIIEEALNLKFTNFKNAVLYASATTAGANCIVTKNCSDFKKNRIPVYSPNELVKILTSSLP